MNTIAFVSGNDVRLRIPIVRHVVQVTGEITVEPLDISTVESMRVFIENTTAGTTQILVWHADPEREGNIVAELPHTTSLGTYNLIVAGSHDHQKKFRSKEKRQFKIVDNNERANITPTFYNGFDAYALDTMIIIDARGRDGLSAYEVAVVNGYVGTEEEWLSSLAIHRIEKTSTDWLVDTYTIYYASGGRSTFTVTNGESSYHMAVRLGFFEGTEKEWLEYLRTLDTGAVITSKIADGAVTTPKIADEAVTSEKLAPNAVTKEKIADGAVVAGKIAPNAVENRNLAPASVTEGNLAPGAVTSDKLAPEVITQLETITDAEPIPGSVKPVQSGGVYDATNILNVIDLSGEPYTYIITAENKWGSYSTAAGRGVIIPITAGRKYVVNAADNVPIAILQTNNFTPAGSVPDFCVDYQGRIVVQAGTSYSFKAPQDANYLYLLKNRAGGAVLSYTLAEVTSIKDEVSEIKDEVSEIKDTLEKTVSVNVQEFSENERRQAKMNIEAADRYYNVAIDYSALQKSHYWINSSNEWNSNLYLTVLIPIEPNRTYRVRADKQTVIAVLTSNVKEIGPVTTFATGFDGRIVVPANSEYMFVSPEDGNYLYVYLKGDDGYLNPIVYSVIEITEYLEELVEAIEGVDTSLGGEIVSKIVSMRRVADSVGNELTPLTIPVDTNGYEIPTTREILNVQKKSRHMADIVWTPLADIPYQGTGVVFPANVPVTGLPYSSVKEIDKYIGLDVSILTFMTAVNNPYSLLYTECVLKERSSSAWGRVYNGVNDCAAYMGTVCSVVTGYCTGQVVQWSTGENKWCAEINLNIVKVFNQSADGLRIGDIYWKPGHVRLIVGLKRDSEGNVTQVQITESIGSHVRQNANITAQTFNDRLANEGGIIYRNIEIYKNRYVPSEFVAVGDETITPYVYNDDICTFAGDRATFRENDLIVLNYNLKSVGGWTAIKVFKDDVLVNTYQLSEIDQSELPEGQRNHALKLGSSHTYGQYKACMTNGTIDSEFTYWEVLQTNVSYNKDNNGNNHIEWSSENGKPLSWTICDISGTVYAHNEFSIEEIANGYLDINLVKFNRQQYPSRPFVEDMYLKVHFEGRFGRVTNEPFVIEV